MTGLAEQIDAIHGGDPESAHGALDELLFDQQSPEVQDAIKSLMARCAWWGCA